MVGTESTTKPDFEKEIRARLESDVEQLSSILNRRRLMKILRDTIQIDLPMGLLEQEKKGLMEAKDMTSAKALTQARQSIHTALILRHYIDMFSIKLNDKALKEYISMATPQNVPEQMFYEWYIQDKKRLEQAQSAVMEQLLLDHILGLVGQKPKNRTVVQIEKELKEDSV